MSTPAKTATGSAKKSAAPAKPKSPPKKTTKKTAAQAQARTTVLEPSDTLFYDPAPKRLRVFRLDGEVWLLGSDLMLLATGAPGNTANICHDQRDWRDETVDLEEGGRTRTTRCRLVSLWGAHEYCVRLFTERSYGLWRWIRQSLGEEAAA